MFGDLVQSAQGGGNGATLTLAVAPTPGNLLVLLAADRNDLTTVVLTSPAGFTEADREATLGGLGDWPILLLYRVVQPGDPAAWVCTFTNNDGAAFILAEFQGPFAGVVDATTGVSGTGGDPTVALTPTAGATVLIVSAVSVRSDGAPVLTPAPGMTIVGASQTSSGGFGPIAQMCSRVVSPAAGPYTVGSTGGGGAAKAAIGTSFAPGASRSFTGEPGGGVW